MGACQAAMLGMFLVGVERAASRVTTLLEPFLDGRARHRRGRNQRMWPHSAQVKMVAERPNHSTLRKESHPLPSRARRWKKWVSPQIGQRRGLPRTSYCFHCRLRRNMPRTLTAVGHRRPWQTVTTGARPCAPTSSSCVSPCQPSSTNPRPAIPMAGGSSWMALIVTPAMGTIPVAAARRSAGRL